MNNTSQSNKVRDVWLAVFFFFTEEVEFYQLFEIKQECLPIYAYALSYLSWHESLNHLPVKIERHWSNPEKDHRKPANPRGFHLWFQVLPKKKYANYWSDINMFNDDVSIYLKMMESKIIVKISRWIAG